jgi:hypothetical protein
MSELITIRDELLKGIQEARNGKLQTALYILDGLYASLQSDILQYEKGLENEQV